MWKIPELSDSVLFLLHWIRCAASSGKCDERSISFGKKITIIFDYVHFYSKLHVWIDKWVNKEDSKINIGNIIIWYINIKMPNQVSLHVGLRDVTHQRPKVTDYSSSCSLSTVDFFLSRVFYYIIQTK